MPFPPTDPWLLIDPSFRDVGLRSAAEAIVGLVRSGGNDPVEIELTPGVVVALARHRVSTLIPPHLVATEQQATQHRRRLRAVYGTQMRIQAAAIDVLSLLSDVGIATRVLKGLASAELDYPSLEYRWTGDVDLAVPPEEIERAIAVLRANGFTDHLPNPPDPRLVRGATLRSPNGVEVDLHTRLFRRGSADDPFECAGVPLTSVPGLALPAERRLVHAAGHLMVTTPGKRRMSGLVDITRILDTAVLDPDRVRQLAIDSGVAAMVGVALDLEATLTGRRRNESWLRDWPRPSHLERATFLGPTRPLLQHLWGVQGFPIRRLPAYGAIWLRPGRERMVAYKGSQRAYWRYLAHQLKGQDR
ncbi:MAG: nucleotidyltransferase family protein [Acidimicrobiia bacterium]|nr:nucleotidyltransferase family protein [Acidimicrobiia bacterium]